jgi:hypothetical protein
MVTTTAVTLWALREYRDVLILFWFLVAALVGWVTMGIAVADIMKRSRCP